MAARRANSILRPSIDDDLSMISTTHVPSGERGGASLRRQGALQRVLFLALLVDVDVVLAGDPHEPAALLDEILERRLARPGECSPCPSC